MNDARETNLERLAAVLDAYGADAGRWPAAERDRLQRLLASDPAAARLLAEARAFDRLLALAEPQGHDDAARIEPLADRILADFASRSGSADGGGKVIAFPGPPRRQPRGPGEQYEPDEPIRLPARYRGWAAVALAAAFVFGVYLGGFGVGGWRLDPVEMAASEAGDDASATVLGNLFSDNDSDEEGVL